MNNANAKLTALLVLLAYLLIAAFTGCATKRVASPSAPVIEATASTVARAAAATTRATSTAKRLAIAAPAPIQKEIATLQKDLAETTDALALASTQIDALAAADSAREGELLATTLALTKTTNKLTRASAAIAHRNVIILVLIASLGGTLLYIFRVPAGRLLAFALRKPLGIL